MPLTHASIDLHGIPCIRLHCAGATAIVALHGAHLLSWSTSDGRERLFLSERSVFNGRDAIRGGVPVIFPQFSERGPLRRHGFARTLPWRFDGIDGDAAAFVLSDGDGTGDWPHRFIARMQFRLDASSIAITLDVQNTGDTAFAFTAALHTYLRVDDLDAVVLEGLQGCDYEDSAADGVLRREVDGAIAFGGKTSDDHIDRIYSDVVAPLLLVDGARNLPIEQDGFGDVVVWNPGAALAATIADLAPGGHRRFVCVEAAQVLQPVMLAPGESWSGTQRLG